MVQITKRSPFINLYIDIDGTLIVSGGSTIPERTKKYIQELSSKGWNIVFITARAPAWAFSLFEEWDSPFYLAVFNGALLYKMPDKKVIRTIPLDPSFEDFMQKATSRMDTALAYYTQNETLLFQKNASRTLRKHLLRRNTLFRENWHEGSIKDTLFAIRCFGREDTIDEVAKLLHDNPLIHAPKMYDSSNKEFFLVQVTDALASKKELFFFMQKELGMGFSIGCGDDHNDVDLLQEVDTAIVMETASSKIQDIGDIIAVRAEKEGLIDALDAIIQKKRKEWTQ